MSSNSGSGIMDGIREKDCLSKLILLIRKTCRNGRRGKAFLAVPSPACPYELKLLNFNRRACVGELLLHFFGGCLVGAFFDGLRCAVNEIFGFFEAETGQFADHFNDRNLVRAGRGQNDGKFRLLFSGCAAGRRSMSAAPAANAMGAAAFTPNFSSKALTSSETSKTESFEICSTSSAVCHDVLLGLLIVGPPDRRYRRGQGLVLFRLRCFLGNLVENTHQITHRSLQDADQINHRRLQCP